MLFIDDDVDGGYACWLIESNAVGESWVDEVMNAAAALYHINRHAYSVLSYPLTLTR